MQKNFLNPSDALAFFWDAPATAVFDQNVIALVTARSISSLQRARWAGFGGPVFMPLGPGTFPSKSTRHMGSCTLNKISFPTITYG